jgi:ABC-type multidrug transport system ATPase subunit
LIRAEGLGKQYGERWAVSDLDVEVGQGEIFGFLVLAQDRELGKV